jgi:hypothetical protein
MLPLIGLAAIAAVVGLPTWLLLMGLVVAVKALAATTTTGEV